MKNTFSRVPKTGVIYVTQRATNEGFYIGNTEWCNLGQGQPEIDKLDQGVDRITNIELDLMDYEYSPVGGLKSFREAIAEQYNSLYRVDKASKYTYENVSVCPGGRSALTRLVASIGNINLGHFIPDYTAYEELLASFKTFNTIPILLDPENGYNISSQELEKEVHGRGLGALLVSNPCNPTGKVITDSALQKWINIGNAFDCTMIMDEFYSSYIYSGIPSGETLSSSRYVDDVNKDPVVIINGMSKNWRYPGWRIAWIVGPKHIISSINSAGSFLDGGPSRPLQKASLSLFNNKLYNIETKAIQTEFRKKRRVLLDGLQNVGVFFEREPEGAFYAWGNISNLPSSINTGQNFLEACLKEKVIVVPGEYFDVNPGKRRDNNSRFKNHIRFSFGPKTEVLTEAMYRLEKVVDQHK